MKPRRDENGYVMMGVKEFLLNENSLQYLMGHSDIGVTLNTYTHLGLEDAAKEMKRMEVLESARKEMYEEEKEKPMKQNMFKAI